MARKVFIAALVAAIVIFLNEVGSSLVDALLVGAAVAVFLGQRPGWKQSWALLGLIVIIGPTPHNETLKYLMVLIFSALVPRSVK